MIPNSSVFNSPSDKSIATGSIDFKFITLSAVANKLSEYTDSRLVNNLKLNIDSASENIFISFYFKNKPKRLTATFGFEGFMNYIKNHGCDNPNPQQLKDFTEIYLKDLLNYTAKLNFGAI